MDFVNTICLLFGLLLGFIIGEFVGFSSAFKRCRVIVAQVFDNMEQFFKKGAE